MKLDTIGFHSNVAHFVEAARTARDQGFGTYWLTWSHGMDPLIAIAIASQQVPDLHFGTSVLSNVQFHPLAVAMAAMTTSQVSEGRFTLGIGASHRPAVEHSYHMEWQPPVKRMREFLEVLLPLLREGRVDTDGELLGASVALGVSGPAPPVMIAALGPKMLDLAGHMTDGTITWMTGPKTLASHTVPRIREAAAAAGRPAPEIVCSYPICVTSDEAGARQRIAKQLANYPRMPSYRAMLDREGVAGPEELALVGDEAAVEAGIRALFDAGATRVMASEVGGSQERAATRNLLVRLLAEPI